MYFGKNLQFLRKMKNMTQEQLAEELDVSRQTVSKWESDSMYPEIDKLIELGKLFSCKMDEMLFTNMNVLNKAYSDIKVVTVKPFRYICYAVISGEPETDALTHAQNWAKQLNIENPKIIGWNFMHVSQEQVNVFHMHGYAAALVLPEEITENTPSEIFCQGEEKYITLTIHEPDQDPFDLIPNAFKSLLTHMSANGMKEKVDPNIITCFEREYTDEQGKWAMDIFIALDD